MRCKLKEFPSQIILKAGLAPSTPYWWNITDRKGDEIWGYSTADDQGNLTITTEQFKPGTLNKDAGDFILQVTDSFKKVQPLTFNGKVMNYVTLEFTRIHDPFNNPHNTV